MDKKQQRKQKALRQKALLDAAKAANRDLTAEERAEFDALQRDIEALDAEIAQEDEQRQAGYIRLLDLCRGIMEACIDVLGFSAPERM